MAMSLKQVQALKRGAIVNYGNFKNAMFEYIKFGSVMIITDQGESKQIDKLHFTQYAELVRTVDSVAK